MSKHDHKAHEECTEACPAFNPDSWRCGGCGRQLPMMADTENWPTPLCFECFEAAAP